MKGRKLTAICLFVIGSMLLSLVPLTSIAEAGVTPVEWLTVSGQKIIKATSGTPIRLTGINFGWWMSIMEWEWPAKLPEYSEEDFRDISAKPGASVIRLSFEYKNFEDDSNPYVYKQSGWDLMDNAINWAKNNNVYVILDFHDVQGGGNRANWYRDGRPVNQIWSWDSGHPEYRDRYLALWKAIAARYSNEPIIAGYDIMNEPDPPSLAEFPKWQQLAQDAVDTIRQVDANHIIFMECRNEGAGGFLRVPTKPLADPANKTAYSFHFYEPVEQAAMQERDTIVYPGVINKVLWDRNMLVEKMAPAISFMRKYNVPMWVGEYASYSGSDGFADWQTDAVEIMQEYDMSYTYWVYKEGQKWPTMGIVNIDDNVTRRNAVKEHLFDMAMTTGYYPNLLKNVSFEQDLSSWSKWGTGGFTRDTIVRHWTENASAKVSSTKGNAGLQSAYVSVTPNAEYRLSGYLRSYQCSNYMSIAWFTSGYRWIKNSNSQLVTNSNPNWKYVSYTATAPSDAAYAQVCLRMDNGPTAQSWFDDLSFVKAEKDLTITNITTSPDYNCNNIMIGDDVTISARIHNSGKSDITGEILVEFKKDGVVLGTASVMGLNAGENKTVVCPVTWTPVAGGKYNITATADPGDITAESNENNNLLTVPFKVDTKILIEAEASLYYYPGQDYLSLDPDASNGRILELLDNNHGAGWKVDLNKTSLYYLKIGYKKCDSPNKEHYSIYVDDILTAGYYVEGTNAGECYVSSPISLGTVSAGKHKIKILFDNYDGVLKGLLDKMELYRSSIPVTNAEITGTHGNSDWYTTDVTVKLTPTGAYSGDAMTEYDLKVIQTANGSDRNSTNGFVPYTSPIVLGDGVYNLTYRSTDAAGNAEIPKEIDIKVDKTAPTFTLQANGTVLSDNAVLEDSDLIAFTSIVEDNLSGIESKNITVDGSVYPEGTLLDFRGKLGKHTVDVLATDKAGNKTEKSFTFGIKTSIPSINRLLEYFIESGDLKGPLVPQLSNSLKQAEHQLEMGDKDKAAKHIEDFIKHLNNEALQKNISIYAKTVLDVDAIGLFSISITARKMLSTINIDGVLEEPGWDMANIVTKTIAGTPDNTVKFGVLWDDNYLYVGATVTDISLYNDSTDICQDDSIEVYINSDNDRGASYDSNDRLFIKGFNRLDLFEKSNNTSGVLHAWTAVSGGYSIELAIPWSNLGITPSSDTVIGFDIGNNDDDDGGDRESRSMWAGDDNNRTSTANFGECDLSSETVGIPDYTLTANAENGTITLYPAGGTYLSGTVVTVTATPDSGFKFSGWSGDLSGSENPATITIDGNKSITANFTAVSVTAKKMLGTVNIDGILDESGWDVANTVAKPIIGNPDNIVKYGVLWDENYLYIGATVTDSSLYSDSTAVYQDDSVEVYIDSDNNHSTTYDGSDRQFISGFNNPNLFEKYKNTSGVLHAWSAISGGYSIEIAIPWSNLSIIPSADTTVIGFDVGNNDDDDGGDRESQSMWVGDGNNWTSTANFGDCVLSSQTVGLP